MPTRDVLQGNRGARKRRGKVSLPPGSNLFRRFGKFPILQENPSKRLRAKFLETLYRSVEALGVRVLSSSIGNRCHAGEVRSLVNADTNLDLLREVAKQMQSPGLSLMENTKPIRETWSGRSRCCACPMPESKVKPPAVHNGTVTP